MAEVDLPDPAAALAAAHRLTVALSELNDTVSSAAALVGRTEQLAPLWGSDESGSEYRQKYTDAAVPLRTNIVELTAGLAELGSSVQNAVSSIADADNPRYFTG